MYAVWLLRDLLPVLSEALSARGHGTAPEAARTAAAAVTVLRALLPDLPSLYPDTESAHKQMVRVPHTPAPKTAMVECMHRAQLLLGDWILCLSVLGATEEFRLNAPSVSSCSQAAVVGEWLVGLGPQAERCVCVLWEAACGLSPSASRSPEESWCASFPPSIGPKGSFPS